MSVRDEKPNAQIMGRAQLGDNKCFPQKRVLYSKSVSRSKSKKKAKYNLLFCDYANVLRLLALVLEDSGREPVDALLNAFAAPRVRGEYVEGPIR